MLPRELVTARVRACHGIHGEVLLESYSGESEHLVGATSLVIEVGGSRTAYAVEQLRVVSKGLLCKLEGVDSRDHASNLVGGQIYVDRVHAARLAADEYYIADLVGCELMYKGNRTGVVTSVWDSGHTDMIDVELDGGGVRTVPLIGEFVGAIDVGERRIELLVDWIIE